MYMFLCFIHGQISGDDDDDQGKTAQQRYKSLFKARSKADLEEYYNRLADQALYRLGQPDSSRSALERALNRLLYLCCAVSPVHLSDIQVSKYQTSARQHMQQRFCIGIPTGYM